MSGRPVVVVGGGNSAGQAALHLAKFARHVTLLVRGSGLAESMSEYLIEQLRSTGNVDLRYRSAVVGGSAVDDCLASVEVHDLDVGTTSVVPAAGLFVLIGSNPHTGWLEGTVDRDESGYVVTGADVDRASFAHEERAPLPLETSMPGVFAIGDNRRGSVKRVATAVGDGAGAVQLIHGYLASAPVHVSAGR